jgi:hypothetical protein
VVAPETSGFRTIVVTGFPSDVTAAPLAAVNVATFFSR